MRGAGGGGRGGLSAGGASTLLGAQDAKHPREGSEAGLQRSEAGRAGDLPGGESEGGAGGVPGISGALAEHLSGDGQAIGTRYPGTAKLFQPTPASVAEFAHHQHDRTLFCGGETPDPAHGLLRECGERGPNCLLDLSTFQRRVAKPPLPGFYTSSLTSPYCESTLQSATAEVYLTHLLTV